MGFRRTSYGEIERARLYILVSGLAYTFDIEPYLAQVLSIVSTDERIGIPGMTHYFTRSTAVGNRLFFANERLVIIRVISTPAITGPQLLAGGWKLTTVEPKLA